MPDAQSGKKKTSKRQHKVKSARQYFRTAKNIRKRRDRHQVAHPNDKQAPENWKAHPVRTSK